jgi:hypothetical protein
MAKMKGTFPELRDRVIEIDKALAVMDMKGFGFSAVFIEIQAAIGQGAIDIEADQSDVLGAGIGTGHQTTRACSRS